MTLDWVIERRNAPSHRCKSNAARTGASLDAATSHLRKRCIRPDELTTRWRTLPDGSQQRPRVHSALTPPA